MRVHSPKVRTEPAATSATTAHRMGTAGGSVHTSGTGVLKGTGTTPWDITEVAGEERRGEERSKENQSNRYLRNAF